MRLARRRDVSRGPSRLEFGGITALLRVNPPLISSSDRRMRTARKLLYFPFWSAVTLTVLGSFVTFYPGAECGWYLGVAALSLAGLFIPSVFYRVGAALLLLLALYAAYSGYRHGVEYREWLSTHGNR